MKKLSVNLSILIVTMIVIVLSFTVTIKLLHRRGYMLITDKDYIEAAEAYMKEKYGEDFKGLFEHEGYVYMNPVEHPEWQVLAEHEEKNGKVIFHDNYVGYLKKRELEKYIHDLIQPIYGECRVYIRPYGFSLDDSWNRDTDILTYTSKAGFATLIYTHGNLDMREENLELICKFFLERNILSNEITITYISKEDYVKFIEKNIDYTNHVQGYYVRISRICHGDSYGDAYIVDGDKNYGK